MPHRRQLLVAVLAVRRKRDGVRGVGRRRRRAAVGVALRIGDRRHREHARTLQQHRTRDLLDAAVDAAVGARAAHGDLQ